MAPSRDERQALTAGQPCWATFIAQPSPRPAEPRSRGVLQRAGAGTATRPVVIMAALLLSRGAASRLSRGALSLGRVWARFSLLYHYYILLHLTTLCTFHYYTLLQTLLHITTSQHSITSYYFNHILLLNTTYYYIVILRITTSLLINTLSLLNSEI